MALKDYVTGTTNKILLGGAGVGLIITAIVGVSVFTPAYQVRDSNGQVKWQVNLAGQSTQSGVIASKTLANCDTIDGTSTGMLVCGTDDGGGGTSGGGNWSGTGALQTAFDGRYVNTSGDTMTGKLLINLTTGTDALEVVQTASASKLHANTLLTVSGSVVVEDNMNVDGLMSFVGYSASPQLTAADTTSGLHFDGPGIVSLHNGGTQTMLLSSSNRVGIGIGSPETKLEVEGTVSGTVLYGLQSLRSSGALTWEGAGSGASLYVGDDFEGAGLSDCDADGQTLAWDATAKRFSCGDDDDTNTTYTAAQGLALNGTAFSLNASHTGTVIRALTTLASSGTLVWEGAASGATLYLGGAFEGVGLTDCDLATQTLAWDATTKRFSCGTDSDTTYTAGQGLALTGTAFSTNATLTGTMLRFLTVSGSIVYAKNTLTSSGTITAESSISGASLYARDSYRGGGLATDCDTAGTSKLLWDATLGRFSCGTDTDTNTTYTAGQGLTLTSTSFRLNATHSGTVIWATTTLRSSGALVVEGNMSGATLNVGGSATVGTFTALSLKNCRYLATDANGLATCGSYPTRTIILTAGGGLPSALTGSGASGPERYSTSAINDSSLYVLEFGNFSKARYAMWTATMPDNYDGGTMTFVFNWRTAATSNDVKWYIQCRSLGDGEAIDQSWGTAVGIADTAGTANTVRTTSATAAVTCAGTPAGGELIQFRVYRDAADAADTLTDTGALISVKGEYLTNSISD